jgi:hypothetical protein
MRHHLVFDKRTGAMEVRSCDDLGPNPDPMQLLRDCPECSAALERGEQPLIMTGPDTEVTVADLRNSLAAQGIDLDAVTDPSARVMYDPRNGDEITVRDVPVGPDGSPDLSAFGDVDGVVVTGEELARIMETEGWTTTPPAPAPPPPRRSLFGRRPRWRDIKRR